MSDVIELGLSSPLRRGTYLKDGRINAELPGLELSNEELSTETLL